MSMIKDLKIRLPEYARSLVLEYGYPFEELQTQLEALAGIDELRTVTIDEFYLNLLLGDLFRSMKQTEDEALFDLLDELYTEIEMQAREQGFRAAKS